VSSFRGKVVAVTGAAGAIGRRCLERFVEEGATGVGIDLRPDAVPGAHWMTVDLASEAAIRACFEALNARFGGVDVLVQSAAVLRRVGFLDLSAEDIDFMHAINTRAMLLAGQEAARSMMQRGGGVIVNLGSVASHASDAVSVGYDASKGGVRSATRGMAVALAAHAIRVVEVAPGPMATPQGMAERKATDIDAYARRRIPLGRWGLPDDVAGAVLFAASDAAAYLTGSTIHVDGGLAAAF
jgi:NAD(P)-dependent dehydrogenase (short-subunit alcohol dehydrogenase family)